eukprot:TRINITY_DN1476_c0_g1_i6.p1 TRINITY_DN1476_c0_g1~~TRINITY_DN1476_c0_g1_i6.p1  ORF type:complete len:234 (+),score=17.34 TRINITY_DN1476_c0_g1_i6:89-790(+)
MRAQIKTHRRQFSLGSEVISTSHSHSHLDVDLPASSGNPSAGKPLQRKPNAKPMSSEKEESVEAELKLPSPHPLPPERARIVHAPIRYAFQALVLYLPLILRKLPKFGENTLDFEKFTVVNAIKTANAIPKEPAMFPTLAMHLTSELLSSQIVYERLYPDSVAISQRRSRHFTELLKIKNSDSSSEETGVAGIESDLVPYYKLKSSSDETLVFESKFESGNLCLALKVTPQQP